MSVLLGVSVAAVLAVLILSAFVGGLEATIVVAFVMLGVALIGFAVVFVQRRSYLRDVSLGNVIERERWSGADLLPPG